MEKLVSVIVPVYNVEKYIKRSINSILVQTYDNLEVLLVDDGSNDRSGTICDEYAIVDPRIRVFHKTNGGQGSARNLALDKMKGNYVFFLDSDDYLEPECIRVLVKLLESRNLDIAVSNYNFINELGKNCGRFSRIKDYKEYNGYQVLQHMWNDEIINIAPWAKLYKSELWHNFQFEECYCEDSASMYKLYKKEMRVGYTGEALVNYVMRASSDVRSFSSKKLYMLEIYKDVVSYAKENLPDYLVNAAISKQVAVNFHVLFQIPKGMFKENCTQIKDTIIANRASVITDSQARKKTRIACLMSYFGFALTKNVFQIIALVKARA